MMCTYRILPFMQATLRTRNTLLLETVLVAAIIGLAAFLRMGWSGVVEFKRDEANLSLLALDFARNGSFPLLGIGSSVGVPNAPINVYLLTIPYFFTTSPIVATQFIGLLNVMAVAATYLFARRYVGVFAALIAVVLFAVSPWGVIFSRKIWAQNMLPLFVVLTIWSGVAGFIDGKHRWQMAHLPLLAITLQIHYAAFVILPVTALLTWIGRKKLSKLFVVSVLLAGMVSAPFVIGMLDAGYDNLDTVRNALHDSDNETALELSDEAVHGAIIVFSGTDIHSLAGPEEFQNYLAEVPDAYPYFRLIAVAVMIGASWLVLRAFRVHDKRTPVDLVLLTWLFAPILLFSVSWTPFFIHYLIPAMPAAFLVVGVALYDLIRAVPMWKKFMYPIAALMTIGIAGLQIWFSFALLSFVDSTFTPDGFGTPLHYLMDVRDAIYDQKLTDVVADVGGQALVFDEGPTVWKALLYELPSVRFIDGSTQVYPANEAIFLQNKCTDASVPRFSLRPSEGCLQVGTISQVDYPQEGVLDINSESATFQNGARLLGYQWNEPRCLELYWEITQPTNEDYFFAVHMLNEDQNRLAQADGLSWFGEYWRVGDIVQRTFCVPELAETSAYIDIGMYTYDAENFHNVDLIDVAGNPAGQVYRIELAN